MNENHYPGDPGVVERWSQTVKIGRGEFTIFGGYKHVDVSRTHSFFKLPFSAAVTATGTSSSGQTSGIIIDTAEFKTKEDAEAWLDEVEPLRGILAAGKAALQNKAGAETFPASPSWVRAQAAESVVARLTRNTG